MTPALAVRPNALPAVRLIGWIGHDAILICAEEITRARTKRFAARMPRPEPRKRDALVVS